MERTKRMTTTANANLLIWPNILRRSQVLACCNSRAENTYKVATIRLLLKFQVTPARPGPTRVFAEIATRSGAPVPRPARQTVLLVQRENHVNRRVDINRIAVEKSRLIAPLAHSIKSGLLQQRVSGENFQGLNRAVLADDGVQADRARDACLTRERRIDGLNTIHNASGLHIAADLERTTLRLRRGRGSAHTADDAAKHAAHRTSSNATRNAAGHADCAHIGFGVFFNNFHFLGNDLGRHQLARVHQMGLRFDVNNLSSRGRRGRGRRGWRRGEHGRHHGLWKRLGVNQWNQNQDRKKCDLKKHRDEDRPRLIGLLRIRTRNHHLFKHVSYLLPAGARRAGTVSPPRVLFPAAGPVPAATPRPRQRFQATTSGAAIPKLEYVPTTIPTTRAKEKARSTWPPIRNRTSTVRKVKPLVKIVRERV